MDNSNHSIAPPAESTTIEISVKGDWTKVPALRVDGRNIIATGKWLRISSVHDEEWLEDEQAPKPERIIEILRKENTLGADLFTFTQKPTDPIPHYPYSYEWESVAAIPVTSYLDWWHHSVSSYLRKDVRRSAKRGISVRVVSYTDEFVRAIKGIYDETPVRQGRLFWHYHKSFEEVKRANATFLDRSDFIGAYLGDELVGFLKIVYVDDLARLMQILAKEAHHDSRPTNALIAKAVEVAAERGCSMLTYGKYGYAQGADGVTAFKHRNGFVEVLVPKYYVPLTIKGKLAYRLHLHRSIDGALPIRVRKALKRARLFAHDLAHRNHVPSRSRTAAL